MNKIPPQNIEYEQALLSACLLGQAKEISEMLSPSHFYRGGHQKIFEAIQNLVKKNIECELTTLYTELKNTCKAEEVGGAAYLSELVDSCPTALNIEHFVLTLKKLAALRMVIEKCTGAIEMAYNPAIDPEETIDKVQAGLVSIEISADNQNTNKIGDLCMGVTDEIEERIKKPCGINGIPSGLKRIDKTLRGFQNSDFIILAARPSMGKTALMLNMVDNAAKSGFPVAVFSLEMSKKQLVYRLVSQRSGVRLDKIYTGFMSKEDEYLVFDSMSRISCLPVYIDDTGGISIYELRRRVRNLKKSKGIKAVFVDYLQLIKSDKQPSRDREVAEISAGLKNTAKELDIPMIVLSQLNRQVENRGDKRPSPADLRDSGTLEQDSDVIMFLYREAHYIKNKYDEDGNETQDYADVKNKAEVNIAKHRNGAVGVTFLHWNDETTNFSNTTLAEV